MISAAGIALPMLETYPDLSPEILALAIGAGAIGLTQVTDSLFWMYKEYMKISVADAFKTLTLGTTLSSIAALLTVPKLYRYDLNMKGTSVAVAASITTLLLASCGSSPLSSTAPEAPSSSSVSASVAPSAEESDFEDGEAEANSGFTSTGSVIADQNREKYVAMGVADEEIAGVTWAGDVSTQDGSYVEYPDGLRIDFIGVKPGAVTESDELEERDKSKSLVTVTLKVSNTGDTPVPIADPGFVPFFVYEGANLEQADQFVGYGEPELTSEDNKRAVGAGSSFEVFMSFQVEPGAQLEIATNPTFFGETHTPFVFTGVTAP